MTNLQLAQEYSRLHNEALKQYRAVFKREGLKFRGNPGCSLETFSAYAMGPENTEAVASFIGEPTAHKYYGDVKSPVHLLYSVYASTQGMMFDKHQPSYQKLLKELDDIYQPFQREWQAVFPGQN